MDAQHIKSLVPQYEVDSSSLSENEEDPKEISEVFNIPSLSSTASSEVIPPQQINYIKDNNSNTRPTRQKRSILNFQTSPVYTDESDADLSDADPTFQCAFRKNNYLFYQSSSSVNSDEESFSSTQKKAKRISQPLNWKQNKMKSYRNRGKSYASRAQRIVPARCLKTPCDKKCRFKCSEKISIEDRYEIFRKFWDLGDLLKQRTYLLSCMVDVSPKYRYSNAKQPRQKNKAFYFLVDSKKIRVCKTFLKATLDISERMIYTVQAKSKEQVLDLQDLRGKSCSSQNPQLTEDIKAHINSIPRIEAHYVRASSSKEYIDGSKTIRALFNDFRSQQYDDLKDPGSYQKYYDIFKTEFNIGLHHPKKDQCDLCVSRNNRKLDLNDELEEKYNTHLEEKDLSRDEKLNDRNKVNNNFKEAVYGLEAVLQCPRGQTASFYYKSKLNCYNLTVTELTRNGSKAAYENVHCYFWSEKDAKRGAVEIGSCVWHYLKDLSDQSEDQIDVVFYSDNCCGQNKNKLIASLYFFAVQNLKINSITHKFLIRGHTKNEADSAHSIIEREVKKNLNSGPLYTPDQYLALIKNAKKNNPPLKVHELNFESFYDLKALQAEWGYNFNTNMDEKDLNWNEIKVLKMTKEHPTTFFYKTSYKQETYEEVNVRNKRRKMKPITAIELKLAYFQKQELSDNKKRDLRDLLQKGLIPSFYESFYNSIL